MLTVLIVLMNDMSWNVVQCKVYQSASGCKSEPAYSDPLLELVMFQFDTVSAAVVYRAVQNWEVNYQISILINAKCNLFHIII